MAGDTGVQELVLVSRTGEPDMRAVGGAILEADGRVIHQYGRRVLIAGVAPTVARATTAQLPNLMVSADGATAYRTVASELDELEKWGLRAFAYRQSDEYLLAKARRPLASAAWDTPDATSPDDFDTDGPEPREGASASEVRTSTSDRLTGSVAVGLVIVEGPGTDLLFSDDERIKLFAEVQNGLSWLGSQGSPGGISWVFDIKVVTLTVAPDPNDDTREKKEARWRDPAIAQLGFPSGLAGVRAYVEKLRDTHDTDWAYCAFFTKYPLGHFAYAGRPRVVMHYDNDNWGPDNIDRVFAHETGHIFGAPDEYASSGCNCFGQFGICQKPNGNCANCAPGGGVACIMRSNSFAICGFTPFHLGFNINTTVPHVLGMPKGAAEHLIRDVCLKPKLLGETGDTATVWKQFPNGGSTLARGGTVTLLFITET